MKANLKVVRNKDLVRWVSVTKNDIEAAFVEWDKNPHPWRTADERQRAVRYNNKCYPPKEIARLAIEIKEGLPIGQLQRDGLTAEETKNALERLGFKYIYASRCDNTTPSAPRAEKINSMTGVDDNGIGSFEQAIEYIQKAFSELNFQPKIDWRFLYSPKATFSPTTKLMVFAQNPRRGKDDPFSSTFPRESFEKGNAYRLEKWGMNPYRPNAIRRQKEVQELFTHIARELQPQIDPDKLMDQTLTSNFCPFASPEWKEDLSKNDDVINFSRNLWAGVLTHLEPAVVICLGNDIFGEFLNIIATSLNAIPNDREIIRVGRFNHEVATIESGQRKTMVLKIPLSAQDYWIMTSNEDNIVTERNKVIRKITDMLNNA